MEDLLVIVKFPFSLKYLTNFSISTGLVAQIRGKFPGPEIGLRCDIDALQQHEDYENPYKSKISGKI